MTTQVYRCIWK